MSPDEGKLTPEERAKLRQEREAATQAEIAEMDSVIFGMDSYNDKVGGSDGTESKEEEGLLEEAVGEGKEGKEERKVVEEVKPKPAGGTEKVVEDKSETVAEKEPKDQDEYDFANFLNDMARTALAKPVQVQESSKSEAKPKVEDKVEEVAKPVQAPSSLIVTKEEMEAAFDSPEKMIEVLGKVYSRARTDALAEAMKQIPEIATRASVEVANHAEGIRQFYADNPDLRPYHDFVRYCAQLVETKHPDKADDINWVRSETVKLVRNQIPKLRQARGGNGTAGPALPGAGGGGQRKRGSPEKRSTLEDEIAEMPDRF